MAAETFKQARARLFKELTARGWTIVERNRSAQLKKPRAVSPDGRTEIEFHPQAIYTYKGNSLVPDMRGVSAADIERWTA